MDLVNHLEGRLLLAVPKKGRLNQATLDLLQGSDIQFRREHRLDIALVKNENLKMALVFLPAADIPTFVGEGRVDLGITGWDQVAEHNATAPATASSGVEKLLDLGFGRCKLQLQVPDKGAIADGRGAIGKNIVTSFTGLTARYFAQLEGLAQEPQEGELDELYLMRNLKTKIKYVGGSVEAACALGVADAIVDLVESGETMKAAGLRALETVVESQAVLIKSRSSRNDQLTNLIVSRIKGVINAQKYVLCQYNIPRSTLEQAATITPGKRAPTITTLDASDWIAVSSMVPKVDVADVMDRLAAIGATDILILNIANSRTE